ncbi:MAG TPA: hypothetical protein VGB52_08465 [Actinomycetota bacterium]
MIRRLFVTVGLAALLVPGAAQADATWYAAGEAYHLGPAGGSENASQVERDPATGEIRVLQFQFTAVSGNLGCNGQGPFAYFDVVHDATETPVSSVTVEFASAVVSPYTFMKLSLIEGDAPANPGVDLPFVATKNARGINDILPGDGTLTLELDDPASGVLTARFGFEVTSNCPAVDGGQATFARVGFDA